MSSGVVDAGVASLRNLGVSVYAAHAVGLRGFGQFSTAVICMSLAIGVSKSLHADPLVLEHAGADPRRWRGAAREALAATSVAAGVAALGSLLVAVCLWSWIDGGTTRLVLAAAATLPAVLLQDTYRWLAHSSDRGWLAVASGCAWGATSAIGIAVLVAAGVAVGAAAMLVVWGAGALSACLVSSLALALSPKSLRRLQWYSRQLRWWPKLLLDFVLLQVTAEGAFVLIAATTSASDLGLLRKAQLPLAPIVVLTTGLVVFLQPTLARQVRSGLPLGELRRAVVRITLLVGVVAAAFGVAVWFAPDRLMDGFVGGDWRSAKAFVPPLMVTFGGGGMAAALGIGLRVMGSLGAQLRFRLFLAPVALAATAWSAHTHGAFAGVICLAAMTTVLTVMWALLLLVPARSARPLQRDHAKPMAPVTGATR